MCWCKPLFKQVCLLSLLCQTGIESPKRKFPYRKLGPDVMKVLCGPREFILVIILPFQDSI